MRKYQKNLQFISYIIIIRYFSELKMFFCCFYPISVYFFFFPEIHLCSRIFRDSWIEWHTRNAINYQRPEAARTTGKR